MLLKVMASERWLLKVMAPPFVGMMRTGFTPAFVGCPKDDTSGQRSIQKEETQSTLYYCVTIL